MSRRRWDRRKGNPWDIDQSDDPNIAIYGEKARPLPLDGKLPTSKEGKEERKEGDEEDAEGGRGETEEDGGVQLQF